MDAYVRVYTHFLRLAVQTRGAYSATERAGDVFDHDLLRYFAYPMT